MSCTKLTCVWQGIPTCLDCADPPPTTAEICTLDVRACPDGSFVDRDPANGCAFFSCPGEEAEEEEDVNCETCACGYNDGCNDCQCSPDGSSVASCTKLTCIWQGIPKCLDCADPPPKTATAEVCTLDVQECPDGSFVGRDPQNDCAFSPCTVDCDVCPGGFFDGCNHCGCGEEGGSFCTLMACAGPELQPKTCHQTPPPPPLVVCQADARVCPDGSVVGRDPANDCEFVPCPSPPTDDDDEMTVGCDSCECGFNDGCNDCQCADDGSFIGCTERTCFWEGIPSCLDCSSP
jgi:hypothetical protein